MLDIAHRGASGIAPEHTFPAYDLALRLGADYIEQDVHMTRDGVLVVLHDATLDRTTGCGAFVADKTFAELEELDAGSWFNDAHPGKARPGYAGLRIPRLEDVFRRYGTRAKYYVETKDPELYPGMEEELLRLISECGLRQHAVTRRGVLIQSFLPRSLKTIRRLDPMLSTIRLYPELGSEAVAATLAETAQYAAGIGPARCDATGLLVRRAHALALDVHPYTVDEDGDKDVLAALGADGVFTNYPGSRRRGGDATLSPGQASDMTDTTVMSAVSDARAYGP